MSKLTMKLVILLGLLPLTAKAMSFLVSYTTVTAAATDTGGHAWENGTWTAELVLPDSMSRGTKVTISGMPVVSPRSGVLNGHGVMKVALPDTDTMDQAGVKWKITLCPNARTSLHGTTDCTTYITATTGDRLDLTSKFVSAAAPRLPAGNAIAGSRPASNVGDGTPGGNNCNLQYKVDGTTFGGDTGTCTDGSGHVSMSTLTLAADPTASLQAATKNYVDTHNNSSAGTPIQKGNSSGGFSNATIADLNLYTPGQANAQGSTFSTQFAAGNTVVQTGPQGATDNPCPSYNGTPLYGQSYHYPSGFQTNCFLGVTSGTGQVANIHRYYPTASPANGQYRNFGDTNYFYDSTLGRSFSGYWHVAQSHVDYLASSAAGIKQRLGGASMITGIGDNSDDYRYYNVISGTSDTGSDEGTAVKATQLLSLGSYKMTANAAYAATTTAIYTTATTGCGAVAAGYSCAGAGRPLLKTSSATNVTITSIVNNGTYPGWGTLTAVETLTPTVTGVGVITNATPIATTDYYNGDTFTSPITISSGTIPSSGIGCWAGQSGSSGNFTHEAVNYTFDGTNITIADKRTWHPANSMLFAGPCRWFVPALDASINGSSSVWLAIVLDAHTIVVTTQFTGNATLAWLSANSAFSPSSGVAARQAGYIYQGADVISVSDPTLPYATNNNLTAGGPDQTGFFKLGAHEFAIASGEVMEQSILPVDVATVHWTACGGVQQPEGSSFSQCHRTTVRGYADFVYNINMSLPSAKFNTGTGYAEPPAIFGITVYGGSAPYKDLFRFYNGMAPTNSIFQWTCCGPTKRLNILAPNSYSLWFDPTMAALGLPSYGSDNGFQAPNGRLFAKGNMLSLGGTYGWSSTTAQAPFDTTLTAGFSSSSAGRVSCDTSTAGNAACALNVGTVKLTSTAPPTCNASTRFTFNTVAGGTGTKDTVQVCAKDSSDTYAWRAIY